MIIMDVFEAIKTRRSIRNYKKRRIGKKKLKKVLEAARLAPSAKNYQPWIFILVSDSKVREKLRLAYDKDWFISAPVIIVACAIPEKAWIRRDGEEYWKVDIAIAMQNLVLAAWEEGLGTCWIADFSEDDAKRILRIPEDMRVVAMTSLGYPAFTKGPVKNRFPLEEVVRYEKW